MRTRVTARPVSEPGGAARRPGSDHCARGRVTLVGGGPGAVDLLTLRAWRALQSADVVVADRLGAVGVLDDLPATTDVVHVGKTSGHHPVPQDEINRIIVARARAGAHVVRLKGGDPFLFGRGGEEMIACREAGIEVDVVPGVTSAVSVPELAGIPVTHRGTAHGVHITSGHGGLDAAALAVVRENTATLVILMGVSSLSTIVQQALRAGTDPATPVAIVENGSTPAQRVTRTRLDEAADAAAAEGVVAPAVIVIGGVAADGLLGGARDGRLAGAGV
ncbi:uroporphyrinogen-III C-methyltransferase [Myceligenerans halotolerans]